MILGLDYGDVRIGAAIAENNSKVAVPFGIIRNNGKDFVISEIKNIIKANDVRKIIVGVPVSIRDNKKETIQTKKVLNFVKILKDKIRLPIDTMDERFTTCEALKLVRGKRKPKHDDPIAAMIILQSYLDKIYCQ